MKDPKQSQQKMLEQVVKQHIFHPLSRFKPTVGSTLLSEQKESLLHAISLIDEIAVDLCSPGEWEEIERSEYARLQPNKAANVSVDFCMLEPLGDVGSMSTQQLLDRLSDLEAERIANLKEYQTKISDIVADPLNLVDPKSVPPAEYKDSSEYVSYIERLKAVLREDVPFSSSYAFMNPVHLDTLELSKEMLEIATVGTVFEHQSKIYALEPYFAKSKINLETATCFPSEMKFLGFEGNYAVLENNADESKMVLNVVTHQAKQLDMVSQVRAFRDNICVFGKGGFIFKRTFFAIQFLELSNFVVFTTEADFYIAFLVEDNVYVQNNFGKPETIACGIQKISSDAGVLMLSGVTAASTYDFVTGKLEQLDFNSTQFSNHAFLISDYPAFSFKGEKIATFAGMCDAILHRNGIILLQHEDKVVVFRENDCMPVLQICGRPGQSIMQCCVLGEIISVTTNEELHLWKISNKLYEVELSQPYDDNLLEFYGSVSGRFHVFDSLVDEEVVAFQDGIGLVTIR